MTRKNIQVLAAVVVALVLLLVVLDTGDDRDADTGTRPLLAGFETHANDARRIHVQHPEAEGFTLQRGEDGWVVSARDAYPADVATLRQLIIALADAGIVEDKTSNPDFYERLAVDDPEDGGSGTKIEIAGEGFSYSVILGNTAQRNFRYARLPDQATSHLIDRNPDVPENVEDWLVPEVLDVPADRIRSVSIAHADGETIAVAKADEELTDFSVLDVPDGRELSYATVGNGIAGALANLELEDVRAAVESTADTRLRFETWDGLELIVEVSAEVGADGDEHWVSFAAAFVPPPADASVPAVGADGNVTDGVENADPVSDDPVSDVADPVVSTAAVELEVIDINDRLSGWQYRLPDFKKNLLTRRWDDILKATDDE